MANKVQMALELRRALQFFIENLDPEEQSDKVIAIPTLFPTYEIGKVYKTKDVFSFGTSSVGDPQLYQVLQDHTSAEQWSPNTATSLYKKIGVSADGTPQWVQPLGASDAYNAGDVVMYQSKKYRSLIDGNVWSPDAYPAGWEEAV